MSARRSAASSPASAASTSASSEPAGPDASRSNMSRSVSESSPSTGPMFTELEMFTTPTEPTSVRHWPTPQASDGSGGRVDAHLGGTRPSGAKRAVTLATAIAHEAAPTASPTSTSSPVGSPASPSHSLDAVRSRTTIVGYGPSSPDAFANYDPATSSWRTSQASFWGEEWTTYSEGWPTSGMTRSGRAFRRRPLVPRTSATASGSWPTPTVMDRPNEGSVRLLRARVLDGSISEEDATAILKGKNPFEAQGKLQMWHTPTASDKDGRPRWDHRASPGHVRKVPVPNLMAQVLERTPEPAPTGRGMRRWRSPNAADHRDRGNLDNASIQRRIEMGKSIELSMQAGGALNPTWVEWLMGFPLGWTDLEPSGMPSSPKSSSSSGDASSKRKRR
jgi:hypothetical protein